MASMGDYRLGPGFLVASTKVKTSKSENEGKNTGKFNAVS